VLAGDPVCSPQNDNFEGSAAKATLKGQKYTN
jgi:hypothetical protein